MALDPEELNNRRIAREKQRKQRRRAKRLMTLRLILVVLVLAGCGFGIYRLTGNTGQPIQSVISKQPEVEETAAPTEAPTERNPSMEQPPVTIKLVAGGDLNITDKVVWAGQAGSAFDYTKAFMDVAPILSDADLSVLNFEGNVCGAPYGTATVSAPIQLVEALKRAGVDMLQLANSCSITNGLLGLNSTLNNIRAAGIETLGAYTSAEEFDRTKGYTIVTINDVKIAFVAFTKGVGGLGMPAGSEKCVNILYTDYFTSYRSIDKEKINSILKAVEAEKPDLTVAMLHWGSEYNDTVYDNQEDIVYIMQKAGVDVIIGSHPHRVQHVSYDELTGNLVAYSLGDFFGDGKKDGTFYSILLEVEITKDYETGITRVTDWSYVPIYTLSETECDGDRRVIRIDNAMEAYEMNFVDKVTKSCYENLKFSADRISARLIPPVKKED